MVVPGVGVGERRRWCLKGENLQLVDEPVLGSHVQHSVIVTNTA